MFSISGLKCDNCTYRDDSVKFEEYKDSIGRRCPYCTHPLLTQEQYDIVVHEVATLNKINKVIRALRWINPFWYIGLVFGKPKVSTTVSIEYPKQKKK